MYKLLVVLMLLCISLTAEAAGTIDCSGSNIRIADENDSTFVYCDGDVIVELRDNRRLRFRATPANIHWVGCKRKPMDLCWAYNDAGVNDYQVRNVNYVNEPEHFAIIVDATKPSVEGTVKNRLDAYWNAKTQKFSYLLTSSLECPLENWYQKSNVAKAFYRKNPSGRSKIEAVDYHIEDISICDILTSENPGHPELYDWLLCSQNGSDWILFPKIHIPFPVRPGNYPTINYDVNDGLDVGGYFGFIDLEEGGWMSQIIEAPSKINFGLCWMFFDVHVIMPQAVPPRHSRETLSLQYKLRFVPVEPGEVPDIMANAKEVPWRSLPEYQLPVLTRNNTFDKLISGKDSESLWWASSWDCYRDDSVGCDDNYSVTIKQTEDKAAGWYSFSWGYPFERETLSGQYRITANVKTADCTGKARLGIVPDIKGDYWVHQQPAPADVKWLYSDTLTGTNNWTQLSVTFGAVEKTRNIILLEQIGPGQSWFDNVVIEQIESDEKCK